MKDWEKRFNQFIDSLPQRVGETPRKVLKDFVEDELARQKQEMVEKIKFLPTGMFDSTPYKEQLLKDIQNNE